MLFSISLCCPDCARRSLLLFCILCVSSSWFLLQDVCKGWSKKTGEVRTDWWETVEMKAEGRPRRDRSKDVLPVGPAVRLVWDTPGITVSHHHTHTHTHKTQQLSTDCILCSLRWTLTESIQTYSITDIYTLCSLNTLFEDLSLSGQYCKDAFVEIHLQKILIFCSVSCDFCFNTRSVTKLTSLPLQLCVDHEYKK